MFSANQKRVSFIVSLNESTSNTDNTNNATDETKKLDSTSENTTGQSLSENDPKSSSSSTTNTAPVHVKPIMMAAGYKQKHFPKLDSIYTSSGQELGASSDSLMHRQKTHQLDSLDTTSKAKTSSTYDSYNSDVHVANSKHFSNNNEASSYENKKQLPAYLQPSMLSKRHIQSHFTPSATAPHVHLGAGVDSFKNSTGKLDASGPTTTTSILKSYHQPQPILSNANNKKYVDMDGNITSGNGASGGASSKIEISRIYSASNKMSKQPFSMSTNDLTQGHSKVLKLPPVNNLKMVSSNNDTIMIGGSQNNINSISISSDTLNTKKKITDLSRYCYFCQRKTGLASSYICR